MMFILTHFKECLGEMIDHLLEGSLKAPATILIRIFIYLDEVED